MDRLASMATFVKAAELGSFSAAAAELGVSPQLVAKQVVFLEDRLHARLLARTTRRQSLTEIGRAYYERCKLVLAEIAAAETLALAAHDVPSGRLRINAPVTFGTYRLAPMVAQYLARYPEVEIDLVLSDRMVDLVEDGFELAFRIGPLADSGLLARRLDPFRQVVCASPAYLARSGVPSSPDELAAHHCLLYARQVGETIRTWRFERDGRVEHVTAAGRLTVNSAGALLTAAIDGFGIAMVAEDLARGALETGRLVAILEKYAPPSRPMHMLFLPDRPQLPKLRSFIDAAIEAFAPRG